MAKSSALFTYADRVYSANINGPLLEVLAGVIPGVALDIGCGAGDNARALVRSGWRVSGLTASVQEATIARAICDQVEVCDVEDGFPFFHSAPFDLVILSHVLEHLRDPGMVLAASRTLVKPDGKIVYAVPNVLYWRQRLKFLFGEFAYEEMGVMDRTHLRFFSVNSAVELARQSSLHVVRHVAQGHIPLGRIRKSFPKAASHLDDIALRLFPGMLASQIVVVCSVAP